MASSHVVGASSSNASEGTLWNSVRGGLAAGSRQQAGLPEAPVPCAQAEALTILDSVWGEQAAGSRQQAGLSEAPVPCAPPHCG